MALRRIHASRGYTLVELLIVIVIMGIAGALVVPSFSQTGVLRVQSAVRMIVSDITSAQSDAVAFQRGMGIIFYDEPTGPRYVLAEVNGNRLDPDLDRVLERRLTGGEFGECVFSAIGFSSNQVVFDGLGGPVDSPGSATPAGTGFIEVRGSGLTYRISVEAYTGRVTVADVTPSGEEGGESGS